MTKLAGDEHMGKWVWCKEHLRAHQTGWCTVSPDRKVALKATTVEEVASEVRERSKTIPELDAATIFINTIPDPRHKQLTRFFLYAALEGISEPLPDARVFVEFLLKAVKDNYLRDAHDSSMRHLLQALGARRPAVEWFLYGIANVDLRNLVSAALDAVVMYRVGKELHGAEAPEVDFLVFGRMFLAAFRGQESFLAHVLNGGEIDES